MWLNYTIIILIMKTEGSDHNLLSYFKWDVWLPWQVKWQSGYG